MKSIFTILFMALTTHASVVHKSPYIPDENHLPPENTRIRQAQEEKKTLQRQNSYKKNQLEKKRKRVEEFKKTELAE